MELDCLDSANHHSFLLAASTISEESGLWADFLVLGTWIQSSRTCRAAGHTHTSCGGCPTRQEVFLEGDWCWWCLTVLEFLAIAVRDEKEMKGIHTGKEEAKFLQFVNGMIVYIENPKNVTKTLLELIIRFPDTKLIHSNPLYSYALTMKIQKEKLRNQSHSPLQQKE